MSRRGRFPFRWTVTNQLLAGCWATVPQVARPLETSPRTASTFIALGAHLNFEFTVDYARNLVFINRLGYSLNQLFLPVIELSRLANKHFRLVYRIALGQFLAQCKDLFIQVDQ